MSPPPPPPPVMLAPSPPAKGRAHEASCAWGGGRRLRLPGDGRRRGETRAGWIRNPCLGKPPQSPPAGTTTGCGSAHLKGGGPALISQEGGGVRTDAPQG